MTLHTPPEQQGQLVDVSYGWHEGSLYMRVHDRSDRTTSWYVADEEDSNALPESWHPVNSAPTITEWTLCDEPQED